jgi:hypothetical protein
VSTPRRIEHRAEICGMAPTSAVHHHGVGDHGRCGAAELGEQPTNCFCRTHPGVARTFARTMLLSSNRA